MAGSEAVDQTEHRFIDAAFLYVAAVRVKCCIYAAKVDMKVNIIEETHLFGIHRLVTEQGHQ